MLAIRIIYGALFIGGIPFAFMAWLPMMISLGVFTGDARSFTEAAFFILCGLCAASGYFIWWQWLNIAFTGRPKSISERTLSLLSIGNHLGWLVFFACLRKGDLIGFARDCWPIVMWLELNIAFAIVRAMLADPADDPLLVAGQLPERSSQGRKSQPLVTTAHPALPRGSRPGPRPRPDD